MKKTIYYSVLFLLIGCATRPHWVQEGKTWEETNEDRVQCYDSELKHHAQFENLTDQEISQLMRTCMEGKGYRDKRLTQ